MTATAHAPATAHARAETTHAGGSGGATGAALAFDAGDAEAGHAEPPSPAAAAAVEHQVQASAHAERAKLSALLAQKCSEIDSHVAHKHQDLVAAAQQHTAQVRADAQAARARVTAEIAQAHARVRSDAQAKHQAIHTWHAATSARVRDGVRARQDRTRKLGDTHAANLDTAAGAAAQRAQSEVNAKAQQARAIGQAKAGATGPTADATDAKRKAANDISGDSASKITGGLGATVSDIHQTGRDAGTTLKQDASGAATQLGNATPQVLAHLATQRDQATQQIAHTEAQAAQAITQAHGQLHQQITTTEQQHLHHLQTAQTAHMAQIAHAGRQAVTALRTQGDKALAAGDHSVAQITGHVRQISVGPRQARAIGDRLVGQLSHGFGSLHTSIEGGAQQMRGGLDHATTGATHSLAPMSQAAHRSFGDLTTHAGTNLHQQTAQVGTQLGQIHTQLQTSGDQGVDTFLQGLDQQIATVDQTLGDKASKVQTKLNDQASSAAQKAGEPVDTVGQRIDEAHARIDEKAKESQKSWLERQFDTLVNMLTDPGFWAALVVGLVLAVVVIALLPAELTVGVVLLGIAAMAVVGALAAGVGTVVSNLCAGRPWNQNLGTNMLIGAVFGAALFGAALLLPEGIVGYLGLAGVAGVLTVITNVATGRPWDEGLLANMLLVGVLAWLGKFLPRGGKGGPVEDPSKPPAPVEDPGKPTGPVPDPNKPTGPVEDPSRPYGPVEDPSKPSGPEEEPAAPRGMPEDLSKIRDSLTDDKAVRQFDAKYNQITKGSENPTTQQLDAFRAYLKSRGPNLDESLATDWDKAHPEPKPAKPPSGDAVQELPGIRDTVSQTRAELEALKAERPTLKGVDRLLGRLSQEEGLLSRMESGEIPADMDASGRPNVRGLKNNIDSIRAELRGAQNDPDATEIGPKFDLNGKKIEIDRVTNNGKTWVDVKNYAPFDEGSANMPKLEAQARQGLELADANKVGNPPHPPEVVWEFPRGVTRSVKAALEAIEFNGRHVRVVGQIVDPVNPPLPVPPPPQNQDGSP